MEIPAFHLILKALFISRTNSFSPSLQWTGWSRVHSLPCIFQNIALGLQEGEEDSSV
jgi:hypothetical protein